MRLLRIPSGPARQHPFVLAILCFLGLSAAAPRPHVYRNEEFGIEAIFPAGSRVCEARSGDHPHGFYVWLSRPTVCNAVRDNSSASAMGIYASGNTSFESSPLAELPCRNGAKPRGILVDLGGLSFRRLYSVSCALRLPDGSLNVVVAAQGGSWASDDNSPEASTPYINYAATLHTRPERLRRDMVLFRQFLARTTIRHVMAEPISRRR